MSKLIKNPKFLLTAILVLTLFLRLVRLDFPNKYVFDEVYHAYTAKEYLAGHKEAWEWWTTPPPGVAYEWTHPPLAKELMAFSMFVLNTQEGFAYRLPAVLFGVLSVYLVFLICKKIFTSNFIALTAAFLFSIDGLNFVQSRTGMNDIYFVTFMLFSVYLLLSNRSLLSAIMLGLSFASKWASFYTILIIFPYLVYKKKFREILIFIIVPPLVYIFTYIPFFAQGHSIEQFIHLHQQMWWYHTGLKASHDYSSPAWSWPINLFPVWYFVDYKDNTVANIFASGNPLVFWLGFAGVLLTVYEIIVKRSKKLIFLLSGYLIFLIPWLISPRIMFLYHYSASIPFMLILLSYHLYQMRKEKLGNVFFIFTVAICIISFILIFPFLTAIHLPREIMQLFFYSNLTKNPF